MLARAAVIGITAFALAASVPGCRPAAGPALDIRVGVRADITGVFPNPPIVNEGFTFGINLHIFDGLTGLDGSQRVIPALADGWETPSDTRYVFQLRRGLRFSDGSDLSAQDVVASLNASRQRGWVNRDYLQTIESVRALDERRVEITTSLPDLALPYELPRGFVLPAQALDQVPVPAVGSGPYTLESRMPGREFVRARNPHYRGPLPAVSRARFVVVPDADERIARLLRGELDVVEGLPIERVAALEGDPRVRVYPGASNRVLLLCMRVARGPLADPRLREAIDVAIDRDELVEHVYGGRAEVAPQVIHPHVVGFDPERRPEKPDRALARALVARAGFPNGFEIRLDGPNNRYAGDVALLDEVRRQLALVGIRAAVAAVDKVEFFALVDSGGSDFHLLGWAFDTGEAGDALAQLFHTPRTGLLGTANAMGLSDPDLDALFDRARGSSAEDERAGLLRNAARRAAEHRAAIPLVIQPEAVATSRRLVWQPPRSYGLWLAHFLPAPE